MARALGGLEDSSGVLSGSEVDALRARLLITRAMSVAALQGPDLAMRELDVVHALATSRRLPVLRAQAYLQAGAIHAMCSNWTEAREAITQVSTHLADLVPREQVSALLVRGLASMSLLDLDEARDDLNAALDLAVEHDFAAQDFKARHNLGCLAYLSGDIPTALRLMAEAAERGADIKMTSARGLLDHGKVLLDAGLVDDAVRVLELALEAADRDHQPLESADVHLDLARAALLRGDIEGAHNATVAAARAFRTLQAAERVEEAELFGAAIDLGSDQRLARAAEVAARWDVEEPITPAERLATRIRVETALAAGQLDVARDELARLDNGRPVALGVHLHERLLHARVADAAGEADVARAIRRAAAEQLALDQGSVHSLEIRAGLALHAERIRAADVEAALASGSADEIFESGERWRAASHRTPPLRPADDSVTAGLVGQLRRLRQSGDGTSDHDEETAALQQVITARLRSVDGDRGHDAIRATNAIEATDAARNTGAAVVVFQEGGGQLVRVVIDSQGVRHSRLGPVDAIVQATARAAADARAQTIARPSMAALLARAREASLAHADALLLSGLELPSKVVIVPTTAIAAMPWRALPSLSDRAVIAAPSVTAWVRRSTTSRSTPTVHALAGPGLARSQEEVGVVTQVWGRHTGAVLASQENRYAVSADVRAALSTASIVHLAAHGRHVDQSPLFSSLDMADGPVFAHELRAPLTAELVILSACDVGRSRGRPGDEPLGLAAALLSLGVQCVVAATTPVPDDVAATAMVDLHEQLVKGVDVATALRDTAARVPGAEAFCTYGNTWSVR